MCLAFKILSSTRQCHPSVCLPPHPGCIPQLSILAQLWHPYVSHSAIENGASEPSSPPTLASACTCRPKWWLESWKGKRGKWVWDLRRLGWSLKVKLVQETRVWHYTVWATQRDYKIRDSWSRQSNFCIRSPPWRPWSILCRARTGRRRVNGGYQRTTGPPAGHSVIHKMRLFYRPPSTLAFLSLLWKSVEVKMENGD